MTTTSLSCAEKNSERTPIIANPEASQHLDRLVEAIRLAPTPAFFAIWQDAPDSVRLFEDALKEQADLRRLNYIRPKNLTSKLKKLQQQSSSLGDQDGIVFLGCLSPMHDDERQQFNAARDRLLNLSAKVIFVESVADEKKVRLGFQDVVSLVSEDCRLFQRDREEDPFPTSHSSPESANATFEPSTLLSGTIHEIHDAEVVCWLEISPGVRVKFAVPLALLSHLNPEPGLELFWNPEQAGKDPMFTTREPKPPEPEIVHEVMERYQRIRKTLEDWQPHRPDDESES